MKRLKSSIFLGMLSLTLAACSPASQGDQQANENQNQAQESTPTEVSEVRVDVTSDITDAVDKVENAVVTVINLQQAGDLFDGGLFSQQLPGGEGDSDSYLQAGVGSGAIYKVDGDTAYIFTNNHVVEGSDAIDVLLANDERVETEIVGADPWTDLAVLAIDSSAIDTVVEFGDSNSLNTGEPAIAVGSPLGAEFASSVTAGVVSGLDRAVPVDIDGDGQPDWETSAIQTDAAINPGNSGGPLVNIAGQVIGVNSMKISSNLVEGMGFAIPSNDAVEIIKELEANGEIIRPVLGITMADVAMLSEEQRLEDLNLPEDVTEGVLVVDVVNNSSADQAGLQSQDVIVSFNGEPVATGGELRQELYSTRPGDRVEVEYYRDGSLNSTTLTMDAGDQSI